MFDKRSLLVLSMLWLTGAAIRIPVLIIPPIIPLIRDDLHMTGTEIGALSGIPMILLAAAALPGSALVGWFGALQAVMAGLLITAAGDALRGLATNIGVLFATTALTSIGIAITQPALPALVRQWLPSRVGVGTAVYSNGMVVGCVVPVAISLTLIMPAVRNNWRIDLLIWSLPIFATLLYVAIVAPRDAKPAPAPVSFSGFFAGLDFGLIWRLGLIFGANNCVYFGTNAFIPPYLVANGQADLVTEALTAYNVTQLPGSLLVLLFASRIERRAWPYVAVGICLVLALVWLAGSTGMSFVAAAGVLGVFSGITLASGLMLPPLLSRPGEVARVAGGMFTLSYAIAMIGTVAGGAVWDLFGHPRYAFAVLVACALAFIVIPPTLDFAKKQD